MKYLPTATILTAFFAGLVLIAQEAGAIGNTLGGTRLFWLGAMAGLALAAAMFRPLARGKASAERIVEGLMLATGLSMAAAAGTSLINRGVAPAAPAPLQAKVVDKGQSKGNKYGSEHYLYVEVASGAERLQAPLAFWRSAQPGMAITLRVIPGYFGFPYVVGFER